VEALKLPGQMPKTSRRTKDKMVFNDNPSLKSPRMKKPCECKNTEMGALTNMVLLSAGTKPCSLGNLAGGCFRIRNNLKAR
jgi:hypothetical protein